MVKFKEDAKHFEFDWPDLNPIDLIEAWNTFCMTEPDGDENDYIYLSLRNLVMVEFTDKFDVAKAVILGECLLDQNYYFVDKNGYIKSVNYVLDLPIKFNEAFAEYVKHSEPKLQDLLEE